MSPPLCFSHFCFIVNVPLIAATGQDLGRYVVAWFRVLRQIGGLMQYGNATPISANWIEKTDVGCALQQCASLAFTQLLFWYFCFMMTGILLFWERSLFNSVNKYLSSQILFSDAKKPFRSQQLLACTVFNGSIVAYYIWVEQFL